MFLTNVSVTILTFIRNKEIHGSKCPYYKRDMPTCSGRYHLLQGKADEQVQTHVIQSHGQSIILKRTSQIPNLHKNVKLFTNIYTFDDVRHICAALFCICSIYSVRSRIKFLVWPFPNLRTLVRNELVLVCL